MIEHKKGITEIIEKRLSLGYNYLDILRTIYGADPREVWEIFKTFNYKKTKNNFKFSNLYPSLPEPHPAYSQWRILPNSKKIILSKLFKKNYKKICFLGCPVLGTDFSNLVKREVFLLDIDRAVLKQSGKYSNAFFYNINEEVPENLKNSFECVVCDPPWYHEDIKLFIKRSAELLKLGGTIYISLPSLLTKPSIPNERLDLQKWLTNSGLIIAEMSPIVEYEVPPFEYMAYRDIPLFTGECWRRGDLLKLKKSSDVKIKLNKINFTSWLEYSFGKKRIFLREKKKKLEYEKPQLVSLIKDDILTSVSRRNSLIADIDFWTSRNEILKIKSGYDVIKIILENICENDKKIIHLLSKEYNLNEEKISLDCLTSIQKIRYFIPRRN